MAIDFSPVNDFFSNIKDKLTNPFFGTLIIVWLTRNWEPVFAIFNFDSTTTLAFKLVYIKQYFSSKNFWEEGLINIGLTILLILIGYIFIIGTRALSITVEHKTMPWITKKVVSKNTVLKSEYDKISEESNNYFKRYEGERSNVKKLSDNYDNLSENYKLLNEQHSDLTTKHEEISRDLHIKSNHLGRSQTDYTKLNHEFEQQKEEIKKLEDKLKSETRGFNRTWNELYDIKSFFYNNNKSFDFLLNNENILKICKQLIENNDVYNFINTVDKFKSESHILISDVTKDELKKYNLLEEEYGPARLNVFGDYIYNYIFKDYKTLSTEQLIIFEKSILTYDKPQIEDDKINDSIDLISVNILRLAKDTTLREFFNNISDDKYKFPENVSVNKYTSLMEIVKYFVDNKLAYYNTYKSEIEFTPIGLKVVKNTISVLG